MRTLTPRRSAAVPVPHAAADSAPSLVGNTRKIRAKEIAPAPSRPEWREGYPEHEQAVIEAALAILRARLRRPGGYVASPESARNVLTLKLGDREEECFAVLFLSAQHGVIGFEELSRGTLTQTSVYPREIVRAALRHNAAAVILAHNHPSGLAEPSEADKVLTKLIRDALALVDVKVLDHFVIAGDTAMSFAERGLL